jgi:hypothetical protein
VAGFGLDADFGTHAAEALPVCFGPAPTLRSAFWHPDDLVEGARSAAEDLTEAGRSAARLKDDRCGLEDDSPPAVASGSVPSGHPARHFDALADPATLPAGC